ncbi:MAG TPA: ferritin-like domain-containing protein [Alphaproteobacteria bacterium]|nr:ferritin-like domain-containing protein [Alphaproteobacteria bacterium]
MRAQVSRLTSPIRVPQRRLFFLRLGQAGLSAAAVALLAGCESMAARGNGSAAASAQDVTILNQALGLEHEAIAAYQLGAESGFLEKSVLDLAVTFQGQHRAHAQVLSDTVRTLGGTPVEPKSAYDFPVDTLKSQTDVLAFAADLEQAAVSAYLGAVPQFEDRALAKAAASILGDEAMHWATLRIALGLPPVPDAFVS